VLTLQAGNGVQFSERCRLEIEAWLRREKPDAILTTHPSQLFELMRRTGAAFLSLPLYSLDLHPSHPVCGGIDQLSRQVGAAGVDLAVAQLHRGETGIPKFQLTMQVEGKWVDLSGTGAKAGSVAGRGNPPLNTPVAAKTVPRTQARRSRAG
jgi:hypothetical protein